MPDDQDRNEELTRVALKVAAVVLGVAIVVGLGSWLMVKGLGLDSGDSNLGTTGPVEPVQPLPTTALPVPSESVPGNPDGETSFSTPPTPDAKGLSLNATPVTVRPMGKIYLTGRWPGKDNLSLAVQRFEDGKWADFGVQASVNVGTYETYVMTGRDGVNRFRMFDPQSGTASNEVRVTVD